MASSSSNVNEKSTKGDIWEAYQHLLSDLQQRPALVSADPAQLQNMTANLAEAKAELIGRFDATLERLGAIQQAYQDADQELGRRKANVIEVVEQDKKQLESSIAAIRVAWEQEKIDHDLKQSRDEDAYKYDLAISRRTEQEVHDQKTKELQAQLAAREASVEEREQVLAELTAEVEAFPNRLDQTAKTARDELAKELKSEYDSAMRDLKQTSEHEKAILSLKLGTAEASIAANLKQIAELQRQLDASAKQLKDMAVAVIQSKNPPAAPSLDS